MNENFIYGVEILVGMVTIPWVVFVTMSIFNLRQEQAVMKMEMNLIREIKEWMTTQKRGFDASK
jgi:hypothetical protein